MLANGVRETTATTGTGTITLAAVTGYPRFANAFAVGELAAYAIKNGNNWEWGVGTVSATNTLARSFITATLVSGTYTASGATAIALSGSSDVYCADHLGSARSAQITNKSAYFVPGSNTTRSLIGSATTANRQSYSPFVLPRDMLIDTLGCNVTAASAGSTVSVGIYLNTRVSGNDQPGALLVSVSALDSATTGFKSGTVSQLLRGNTIYWASDIASAGISLLKLNASFDGSGVLGVDSAGVKQTTLYEAGAGSTLVATAATALTLGNYAPTGIFMREA